MHTTHAVRCRGIIIYEGKLLAVKHANKNDFYVLPGGHLDYGEDPEECMKRELVEELGIEPVLGRLLYVHTFSNAEKKQSIEFFFEIKNALEYKNFNEKERTHAHELEGVVWLSPEDSFHLMPEAFEKGFREGRVFDEGVRFMTDKAE